jgi:hypothetical protein
MSRRLQINLCKKEARSARKWELRAEPKRSDDEIALVVDLVQYAMDKALLTFAASKLFIDLCSQSRSFCPQLEVRHI